MFLDDDVISVVFFLDQRLQLEVQRLPASC